ncbi:MAG: SDR family oxidoreductase [Planctomycetota bacterium]
MPRRPTRPAPPLRAPPLSRRVALVTGGARRVGRAIVLALADAGADVAIHAHRSGREARALARAVEARGRRAAVLTGDLADPIVARALPLGAADVLGRLDVLVHNAAVFAPTDPRSADAAAWDAMMDVNARAAWLLTSSAAPLLERRGGAVVHVACASAASPWAGFLPYSASKAALVALVKGFAKALAPAVRVNAVAPGPVLAPDDDDRWRASAVATTLLRRWGTPADVAAAVVFLATAPFITGAVLPVDGGRHLRG